ncbi:MerR family transcriptional regulator [Planomonospora parontospora subsp. parontospora]|uniref:MerR family transcriptional regulator n=2 Tax=Planomonospora parontospora TaxID=58119 RepID=A0AA37BMD2_9ACTN|nr:MerR family transcriptional regulator [Planomonospora parontospora]GGK94076.1 MerR family transcriptional regulator [Planomonospora parontospora]GII13198.1 MerR family transcriptional regulator [Planomonospora parontospora subsp. parontospora]
MDTAAEPAPADPADAAAAGQTGHAHLHIGQVAERTGLSLRTIRHYEEVGLVPASARSQGGFRLYTDADVARLMVIRRMKPLGFTLEQMGELLAVTDRLEGRTQAGPLPKAEHQACLERLEAFEAAARERCAALRTQLQWAEEFADDLHRRRRQAAPVQAGPQPGR